MSFALQFDPDRFKDNGWAWVVMCGAFFVHFLTAGCEKAFSIWYIEIMDIFNTNSTTAASLGGFCAAIRLLLAPITVILCDKFTIQYVVILGGILSCIGLLLSALTTTITGLYIGFGIIYGFGLTMVFTPALVVCTIYFEKHRATALSLSLAGAGFGAFAIPQIVAKLLRLFGYRGAMLIMSSVVLHYSVSGAIFFTPPRAAAHSLNPPAQTAIHVSIFAKLKSKLMFLELVRDGWFMLFIASFVLNMMGSGPVTTLIIHYAEEIGAGIKYSIFLFAIEGGVQIFARSLSGLLFDQSAIRMIRGIVWCCDIILSASVVCLFAMAKTFITLAVLMGFRGLFLAIYISHQTLMTCDMHNRPKEAGLLPHAIGMTQLSKGVGILLGSTFSGMLRDTTGDYRVAFLFLGISQMIGAAMALVAIVYRKHHCFCISTSSESDRESQEGLLATPVETDEEYLEDNASERPDRITVKVKSKGK